MNEFKNINTASDFENRTGLIVWLNSKRSIKRLMNYGLLHYVSKKMDYAIIYVDEKKRDETIERLKKERFVKAVEISQLRDLPSAFDDVLTDMRSEIEEKKRQEKMDDLENDPTFNEMKW